MSKISIEEVESILLENKIEPAKVQSIIKQCGDVVEELKGDKDTTPKQKYSFIIILDDKENILAGKEIAGWVVQQKSDADAGTLISRLRNAASAQNEAAKRKKNRITDLASLFAHLKSKFLNKEIKIKTKDLTRVIVMPPNSGF